MTATVILRKIALVLLIIISVLLLLVFAVVLPIVTYRVYGSIFDVRITAAPYRVLTAEEFGLTVEETAFSSNKGQTLFGCHYAAQNTDTPHGVVVVAHGFGGGGHSLYMPLIAYFCRNGYAVFSYDATGNDASEGEYVGGLPQGVADLDHAINFVKADARYAGLPLYLAGHSWGGFSVGNVLNFHRDDIAAAVIFAGFNESKLLIEQTGRTFVGDAVGIMLPYVSMLERIRFGQYAGTTAVDGIRAAAETDVMVVHSTDDETVLIENGYDIFYAAYGDDARVRFRSYDDRGHNNLYYDPKTWYYRDELHWEYDDYVFMNDLEDNDDAKKAFREEYVDVEACFAPDEMLMAEVLEMFRSALDTDTTN